MARTSKTTFKKLEYDEETKGFRFKCITTIREFDTLLRKWVKQKEKPIHYESLESHGLLKSFELNCLIKRLPQNYIGRGRPKAVFFLQKFKISVPKLRTNRFIYLKKGKNGKVYKCNLKVGCTYELSVTSEMNQDFVHRVGMPKRSSLKQASKMLKNKEVYPQLLRERGNSFDYELI